MAHALQSIATPDASKTQQTTNGSATAQTIHVSEAPHQTELWPQLAGLVTGVVIALLAAWVQHYFSAERDATKASFDRDAAEKKAKIDLEIATLKFQADRDEAIRSESNRRRIDAMQILTTSLLAMLNDLEQSSSAKIPLGPFTRAENTPHAIQARTMVELYFLNRMVDEWNAFLESYTSAYSKGTAVAHERSDGEVLPESGRINLQKYSEDLPNVRKKLGQLLTLCGKLMKELVPHPDS
jgi:hypothetical protein